MRLEIKKIQHTQPEFAENNYYEYVKHVENITYVSKEYVMVDNYEPSIGNYKKGTQYANKLDNNMNIKMNTSSYQSSNNITKKLKDIKYTTYKPNKRYKNNGKTS